jgi:hypothetical protein
MLTVLLKLIVTQPQLLLAHATNYADLMTEGVQHTFSSWKSRMLLFALSAVLLALGAFSGIGALLLWGALPSLNPQNAWVLVALPFVLLSMSVFFYSLACRCKTEPMFSDIQEQLNLDLLAINQVRAP